MSKKWDKTAKRIWNLLISKMIFLKDNGETFQDIGDLMGVSRSTVKNWIDGNRRGERVSFSDMLRYMEALGVSLTEISQDLKPCSELNESPAPYGPSPQASPFDKELSLILNNYIVDGEIDLKTASIKHYVSPSKIAKSLSGKHPVTAEILHLICMESGQNPKIVLNEAARKSKEHSDLSNQQTGTDL